jgi:hypothetical protein
MPCHAMHPIQDLFWESFSYELQFDMHSYLHKNFILAKSGCYSLAHRALSRACVPNGCFGFPLWYK